MGYATVDDDNDDDLLAISISHESHLQNLFDHCLPACAQSLQSLAISFVVSSIACRAFPDLCCDSALIMTSQSCFLFLARVLRFWVGTLFFTELLDLCEEGIHACPVVVERLAGAGGSVGV